MITYLEVRNLAIVEELAIEPGAGLNVLTGETGAGKSLLIDSLEFLRGARGSTEMIRAGAEKMTAAAVFQLPKGTLQEFADDEHLVELPVVQRPAAVDADVVAAQEVLVHLDDQFATEQAKGLWIGSRILLLRLERDSFQPGAMIQGSSNQYPAGQEHRKQGQ